MVLAQHTRTRSDAVSHVKFWVDICPSIARSNVLCFQVSVGVDGHELSGGRPGLAAVQEQAHVSNLDGSFHPPSQLLLVRASDHTMSSVSR